MKNLNENLLVSEVVKARVNKFGELHLDKESAESLCRWLLNAEKMMNEHDKAIALLKELKELM